MQLAARREPHLAPALESIRRRLGLQPGLGRRLILTEHGGYSVANELVDVDVDRFESLVRRAASAESAERRSALDAATALGEGELLADEPYAEWALPARAHCRALRIQALIDLAECCLELDDHRAALAATNRVLALERTSERAYRAAMLAHHALGDRDEALRAYDRCRTALSEDIGVPPGPEASDLHAAILRDEPPGRLLGRGNETSPLTVGRLRAALPVGYTDNNGVRIAFQVVGQGPPDLVFSPSFVTNLGATWDDPTYAAFLRRLASMARLILFDKRGTGLSDPALDFPTTRERSDDLVSVLDAAGSERAVLFGVCGGGGLCVQFAADHPDRTAGMVLHNSLARVLSTDDYPWGLPADRYERFLSSFEEAWLRQDGIERRNPGLADNPRYKDWFARYMRLAASPWMARRLAELNAAIDIRALLPRVEAPCLVICRTEDAWLSPQNSRYLAANITDAELLELPGVDHDPWVGDTEPVLDAVDAFLGRLAGTPRALRPSRGARHSGRNRTTGRAGSRRTARPGRPAGSAGVERTPRASRGAGDRSVDPYRPGHSPCRRGSPRHLSELPRHRGADQRR
ncbi:MAG: alpha/beta fold hydrolase [Acidimicrobiales bacterium]